MVGKEKAGLSRASMGRAWQPVGDAPSDAQRPRLVGAERTAYRAGGGRSAVTSQWPVFISRYARWTASWGFLPDR